MASFFTAETQRRREEKEFLRNSEPKPESAEGAEVIGSILGGGVPLLGVLSLAAASPSECSLPPATEAPEKRW
jgi:hypothetical protein